MSKRIRVTVTQEDIDRGLPRSGAYCPIARAVQRAGYPQAHVARDYWLTDRSTWNTGAAPLPRSAGRFIRSFDAGKPVQPATFLLPLPADVPD